MPANLPENTSVLLARDIISLFFFPTCLFFSTLLSKSHHFLPGKAGLRNKNLSCSRLLSPLGENSHSNHLDSETAPLHITGLHIPQESGHAFSPSCSPLSLPLWPFSLFSSFCISMQTWLPISLAHVPALSLSPCVSLWCWNMQQEYDGWSPVTACLL